jgi:hypothetical protein
MLKRYIVQKPRGGELFARGSVSPEFPDDPKCLPDKKMRQPFRLHSRLERNVKKPGLSSIISINRCAASCFTAVFSTCFKRNIVVIFDRVNSFVSRKQNRSAVE